MQSSLVKAHRILAVGLGVFIISHLAIHLTAVNGADIHIAVLSKFQGLYRNWLIEPLLIIAIFSQIWIGARLVKRRFKQAEKGFWGWAQILSGCYLAMFMIVHGLAALSTRHILGLETNFYWAAGTLNIHPLPYFFAPYYFFGVMSVFIHLGAAVHFGWAKHGARVSPLLVLTGLIVSALILAAFGGWLYGINLPPEVTDLFQKYIPG